LEYRYFLRPPEIFSSRVKGSITPEGEKREMSTIMHDARKETRVPQNKTGIIRFGAAGHEVPCIVTDLTPRGAGIALGSAFDISQFFLLTVDGETEVRHCRVRWAQGSKLGVSFQ
jgi:hypothetical protein